MPLYMVVEHFKNKDAVTVYRRFLVCSAFRSSSTSGASNSKLLGTSCAMHFQIRSTGSVSPLPQMVLVVARKCT